MFRKFLSGAERGVSYTCLEMITIQVFHPESGTCMLRTLTIKKASWPNIVAELCKPFEKYAEPVNPEIQIVQELKFRNANNTTLKILEKDLLDDESIYTFLKYCENHQIEILIISKPL